MLVKNRSACRSPCQKRGHDLGSILTSNRVQILGLNLIHVLHLNLVHVLGSNLVCVLCSNRAHVLGLKIVRVLRLYGLEIQVKYQGFPYNVWRGVSSLGDFKRVYCIKAEIVCEMQVHYLDFEVHT